MKLDSGDEVVLQLLEEDAEEEGNETANSAEDSKQSELF